MTATAILYRDEIIAQVANGSILRDIAARYGVTKQALHQVLKKDPDYREALKDQSEALIEEAKEETWAAREALDIARAREISKYAFRYAESIDPARWAAKGNVVNIQVNVGPAASLDGLADNLLGAVRVIEQLPQKEAGENEGD